MTVLSTTAIGVNRKLSHRLGIVQFSCLLNIHIYISGKKTIFKKSTPTLPTGRSAPLPSASSNLEIGLLCAVPDPFTPFIFPFTLVGESDGRDTPQAPVTTGARFSWAEDRGGKSVDCNDVGCCCC